MGAQNLEEVFRQAAQIAGTVPKEFREAAFNRALDTLLGTAKTTSAKIQRQEEMSRNTKNESDESDPVNVLLANLNRTKHTEVVSTSRVLDRSLFLIRAARDDHQIDGLRASQIAKVLTEKFRLKTTRQAVAQALDGAGDKVDRMSVSGAVSYRLMHPGDEYLNAGEFASSKDSKKSSKKGVTKNTSRKEYIPNKTIGGKISEKPHVKKKVSPKTGRPGPGAILTELTNLGFFAKHRSIVDIQNHCKKILAHNYALNELSTPLRRAVHSGLLKRDHNAEGQYEYSAP